MKRIFFLLLVIGVIFPLHAEAIDTNAGINSLNNGIHSSDDVSESAEEDVNSVPIGIHSGLGPNTGRSVNHNKGSVVPGQRSERYETILNNSGTGTHGPGTY